LPDATCRDGELLSVRIREDRTGFGRRRLRAQSLSRLPLKRLSRRKPDGLRNRRHSVLIGRFAPAPDGETTDNKGRYRRQPLQLEQTAQRVSRLANRRGCGLWIPEQSRGDGAAALPQAGGSSR